VWVFMSFCLAFSSGEIMVSSTGIYNPLDERTVARHPNGNFYVLDSFEQQVVLFGSQKKRIIAKKGPGPGEIQQPNRVLVHGEDLIILTAAYIHYFDKNGVFKHRIHLPPGLKVYKAIRGWVGEMINYKTNETKISLYDSSLNPIKTLLTWDYDRNSRTRVRHGETTTIPVFLDVGNLSVSKNGKYMSYREPGISTIYTLNLINEDVTKTLKIDKRVPFNKAVGERFMENLKTEIPNAKLKGAFPKYFPPTSDMYFDHENVLYVHRWTRTGSQTMSVTIDGQKINRSGLSIEKRKRIIASEDNVFFVGFRDSITDQMGIAKVPSSDVGVFLSSHPLSSE